MGLKILPGACILLLTVGNYFGGLWFCGECFVIVYVGSLKFSMFYFVFAWRPILSFHADSEAVREHFFCSLSVSQPSPAGSEAA